MDSKQNPLNTMHVKPMVACAKKKIHSFQQNWLVMDAQTPGNDIYHASISATCIQTARVSRNNTH